MKAGGIGRGAIAALALGAGQCGGEGMVTHRAQEGALGTAAAQSLVAENTRVALLQVERLLSSIEGRKRLPRSLGADGKVVLVPPSDWTSGFFPGVLWLLFELSGEPGLRAQAARMTALLEQQQWNKGTHDTGFMMGSSYGNGYRLTGDPRYLPILLQTAASLSTRYKPAVGCIRSWDFGKWQYPVIIDNMMNLELLYLASAEGGDPAFARIADAHATRTSANHFREDGSSVHVVDYDPISGAVLSRGTHQGLADASDWARGQAWGLYGFTMAHRQTRDPVYLERARTIADFILGHPALPADLVPYWDYDAPGQPEAPRDASAAAITCAALYELGALLGGQGSAYIDAADRLLASLSSEAYRAKPGENGGFLLEHSVGNWPAGSEIDVPLVYADYYFLEANLRRRALTQAASSR